MSNLELFTSWGEVFTLVLITIVEISIFLMVYSLYKVIGVLRFHPGFASMMREAKENKAGVTESESDTNSGEYLDDILGDDEDG